MSSAQVHPNFRQGGNGMPINPNFAANPQQLQAQIAAQHAQQMAAAQAHAARTGGDGKHEYMKGSSAWIWALLIIFFIIIIVGIAWFLWSGNCRRRGGKRCGSGSDSSDCEKPRKCGKCHKSRCECENSDH